MLALPPAARYVVPAVRSSHKMVLLDVMDTLVADPFWRGFERDLFGMSDMKELFAVKDAESFLCFERGEISEEQHFATYFRDRRPVDGDKIRTYLSQRYHWIDGMHALCTDLKSSGVEMAAFSNYPAQWAPLVESACELSQLCPWAFVSGEHGVRKPSKEAFEAALAAVGLSPHEVIFVDDSVANCEAAESMGIETIRFQGASALRMTLHLKGYPLELSEEVLREGCLELSTEEGGGES